jgi:hypothetical protein
MSCKGFGKNKELTVIENYTRILPGGTEKTKTKKNHSGRMFSEPGFDAKTSRVRSMNVNFEDVNF